MDRFQKLALAALLAVLLLLFVGAIVRASGSGLGCRVPRIRRLHTTGL